MLNTKIKDTDKKSTILPYCNIIYISSLFPFILEAEDLRFSSSKINILTLPWDQVTHNTSRSCEQLQP